MNNLKEYIQLQKDCFIEDLVKLCAQPSISAQNKGLYECATLLRDMMREVGIKTRILRIKNGNPVVYGEVKSQGSNKTLGFYNHYDVQPPDPLEEWKNPPFKPTLKNGKIYGRGVSDNKGGIIARLEAMRVLTNLFASIPINLKFFIEGEEEIGSPHLESLVRENKDLLKADGYIWESDGVDHHGRPKISLGVKGILYVEFIAKGPKTDVHSSLAPIVPNPAWRLVWLLSNLKDINERIMVPGWYNEVILPSESEMKLLSNTVYDEETDKLNLGIKEYISGLSGIESQKALRFSPTCNICGFVAGYTGSGSKTVLPSKARVKVDFRLVEAQRPKVLLDKLRKYLKEKGFNDIEIISYGGYQPAKTSPDDPFVIRIRDIAEKVYNVQPLVYPSMAGTSPIYTIKNLMEIPVVSTGGVGYPSSKAHSPNENIKIKDFFSSIEFLVLLIQSLSRWN